MKISLEDVLDLLAGRRRDLQVGTLPHEAKKHFRCSRDVVLLSSETVLHILERHGDHIGPRQLLLIPTILERGMWISDRKNSCCVCYEHKADHESARYLLSMKITQTHQKYYIRTLHKMKRRQTKAKLNKGKLIREHWTN